MNITSFSDLINELYRNIRYVNSQKEIFERIARREFVLKLEEVHSYDPPQDDSLGSMTNPIQELSKEITSGHGWVGNETILEDLIVQLCSYAGLHPWRQIAIRSQDLTSKNKSRRLDLFLNQSFAAVYIYSYARQPSVVIEFKSNYIDDTDINEACFVKNYPQNAYNKLGKTYPLVFQFVSPAGITENGLAALRKAETFLQMEFPKLYLSSVKLEYLVWQELYPAIERAYCDERGKIGRQFIFVRDTVEQLGNQLTYPEFWLEDYKSVIKNFNQKIQAGNS